MEPIGTTLAPMDRPTKGCCGTCAWLAKSATPGGTSEQPQFAIYDETEQWFRDNPSEGFQFVPVGINAYMQGRLVCFRRAATLHKEATDNGIGAWTEVIWRDRQCPKWSLWEPGVSPREQLADERSRKFTLDLKAIETRLTLLAIKVAIVIGVIQLLMMTPDSYGGRLLSWVFRPFLWLRYR